MARALLLLALIAAGPPLARADDPVLVKLVDPGAEPRRALRLETRPGSEQTATLSFTAGFDIRMGETRIPMGLPRVEADVALTVERATEAGTIPCGLDLKRFDLAPAAGANPLAVVALAKLRPMLEGAAGTLTLDPRGAVRDAVLTTPALPDEAVRQVLGQLLGGLQGVFQPYPEGPVGIGAKWEVKTAMVLGPLRLTQVARHELISLEGTVVRTRIRIGLEAERQALHHPRMPAGLRADLEGLRFEGEGELRHDLRGAAPQRLRLDLKGSGSLRWQRDDAPRQEASMTAKATVEVRSG